MVAPRYSEIATFMRAPYATSADGVDIALIGVPYDGGTTNRAGARHGPREIRNMSSFMRSIHHVTRCNPYELCKVADLGDVRFTRIYEDEAVVEEIAAFYREIHRHGAVSADSRRRSFDHVSPSSRQLRPTNSWAWSM